MYFRSRYPYIPYGLFTDAGGGTAGGGAGVGDGSQGKTFTQEELDRIIADRLNRERDKYKDYGELKKAAEEISKLKESQMSEAEKMQSRVSELEKKLQEKDREAAEARLEAIKLKILDELGLPKAWAGRIFGASEDELRVDAKNLEKLLKESDQGKGGIGSGSNPGAGGADDPTEQGKRAAEERNRGRQTAASGYDPWAIK